MNHFFYQLKRVKIKEMLQVWKLPVSLLCMPFYRLFHKNLWIICEDKNEARDNGYWLFKYLREKHPEQDCVYAIAGDSPDIDRIILIGKKVEYGSLKHWIMYFTATKKISSQKAGNPNAAIFYFLEVYGFLKDKRVFLQHGITKDNAKWLYYRSTGFSRFICGAYPEFRYVESVFGYPAGNVCYTGFCRFDGLHDHIQGERIVLIMPTWREWIADEDYRLKKFEGTEVISDTVYFRSWIDFITDENIRFFSEKYKIKFLFFPHRNMQQYMRYFPQSDQFLEVADAGRYGVQELLKKASMLVTDYSSVFFDMVYMKKPVVFYQFDYELFRSAQYGEGYFDYHDNPFGKSCRTKENVFSEIEGFLKNGFSVSQTYEQAHKEYFRLFDTNNCSRVYDIVNSL